MARALRLAEQGLFTTTPNPRVGCVLVRDGAVVGEGWHQRAGEAHAEVHALAARQGIEMPICEQIYAILYQGKSPREAALTLLGRDKKLE